jgi:ATP-dependent RNA helicase RhlE
VGHLAESLIDGVEFEIGVGQKGARQEPQNAPGVPGDEAVGAKSERPEQQKKLKVAGKGQAHASPEASSSADVVGPRIEVGFGPCNVLRSLSDFSSFGLTDALLRALADASFTQPTPVQEAAIPHVLRGADLWASAKTGSGKTAAFVLPILQRLAERREAPRPIPISTLVLAPTRELAAQTADTFASLGAHLSTRVKTCVAVGGVSINPQMLALRGGADVVVATPGRLLDLLDHNALRLDSVRTLVLDEADRLLSLGFAEELTRIRALLPARCQRLLFSATFPPGVRELIKGFLHEPEAIDVDGGELPDASTIAQRAIQVDERRRTELLRHLLETHAWPRLLVFVATKYATEHLTEKLMRHGVSAAPMHGELSQGARTRALRDFKASRLQVLVATDLAARGLDIAELPAVLNFDLPRSAVDYVHRIGRTGRAGEEGVALSFITAQNSAHFALIERRHRLSIEREVIPGFEPQEAPIAPNGNGGVKGKRLSKKDKLRRAGLR